MDTPSEAGMGIEIVALRARPSLLLAVSCLPGKVSDPDGTFAFEMLRV